MADLAPLAQLLNATLDPKQNKQGMASFSLAPKAVLTISQLKRR